MEENFSALCAGRLTPWGRAPNTLSRRLPELQTSSELYAEKKHRLLLPGMGILTDFHYIQLQFKDA
jgi:hypothetical protein